MVVTTFDGLCGLLLPLLLSLVDDDDDPMSHVWYNVCSNVSFTCL